MALLQDAFRWKCPPKALERATEQATERIRTAYARDKRLNRVQRVEKIRIGYLGEYAFWKWCHQQGLPIEYLGKTIAHQADDGDFQMPDGRTIDVKTQATTFVPQPHWRCEVTHEQRHRPASLYVFAKLLVRQHTQEVLLLGWMEKQRFFEQATFRKAGERLQGKQVHYPKWDVTIANLRPLPLLKQLLKNTSVKDAP